MWALKTFLVKNGLALFLISMTSIGGVAWFKYNYVHRSEVQSLRASLESSEAEISAMREMAEENRKLLAEERRDNAILERTIDQWASELRRLNSDEVRAWRDSDVPVAVSGRLHNRPDL